MRRFIATGDQHGNLHDTEGVRVLFEFTKFFKPHLRINLGDLFDLKGLRCGASDYETSLTLQEDLAWGKQFLGDWKPHVFLLGNHDIRLWRVAREDIRDGMKRDAAQKEITEIERICRKIGCDIFPYDKRQGVYTEGRLSFIHGFHHGKLALKHAVDIYDSVVCGHNHTPQTYTKAGLIVKHGFMSGCLCQLDHEYNATHTTTLAHAVGFVYGFLYEDGSYEVFHATKGPCGWALPTEWRKF